MIVNSDTGDPLHDALAAALRDLESAQKTLARVQAFAVIPTGNGQVSQRRLREMLGLSTATKKRGK